MTRIYAIRHCSACGQDWEAELTEEGKQAAVQLANMLSTLEFDRIVSSPMLRAKQTIEPLAAELRLETHLDERLAERVLSLTQESDWLDHLRASFVDDDYCLPGGESSRTATARIRAAVDEIVEAKFERVALVTHGNLLTLLLRSYDSAYGFENWASLRNPDVFEIDVNNDQAQIRHLQWNQVVT